MPATVERQVAYKVWLASLHGAEYVKQEGWAPNYVTIGGTQISRVHVVATVVSKFIADDGNYGALTLDDGSDTIRVKAFGPDVKRVEAAQVGKLVRFVGKVKEYNDEVYLSPEIIRAMDNPNWLIAHRMELGEMPPRAEGTSGSGTSSGMSSGASRVSPLQQQSLGVDAAFDSSKEDASSLKSVSTPQTATNPATQPAEVIISEADITGDSKEAPVTATGASTTAPEANIVTDSKLVAGKPEVATDSKAAERSEASPEESINAQILALIGELDAGDGASTDKLIEALGLEPEVAKPKIAELLASGEIYEPKKGMLKLL